MVAESVKEEEDHTPDQEEDEEMEGAMGVLIFHGGGMHHS